MTIPPFPSQDLAKLVLGYLREEQLMTVYDEFLQASPYLNEYDRIFMTSLKSILAEYRAVKIYVDTCKPFALRKAIFQCTNLLDVIKFLVANVDLNKIQSQEVAEKASLVKLHIATTPKPSTCELCHSLKLPNCVCKLRQTDIRDSGSISASHVEATTLQSSVETTPLADLPGNHVTKRKKNVKVLEKDSVIVNSNASSIQNDSSAKQSFSSHISPEEYLANCQSPVKSTDNSKLSFNSTVKAIDPSKSKQNIEEFDNVLKSVVNRNKTLSGSECLPNQRISNAGTFQNFASGVSSGESQNATYNVPDSSTSENINVRVPVTKNLYNDNIKGPPQCHQLLLQVSPLNDNLEIQACRGEISRPPKSSKFPKLQPKPTEQKITIISDVKVGTKDNIKNKSHVTKNATSTPLMQMQTIMINGTPAYKHTSQSHNYTKDEIMAMPTLIVVPASGPSQVPTSAHCESIMTQNCSTVSKGSSSPRVLGPLVIDVPNKPIVTALPDLSEQKSIASGLVKTVTTAHRENASVPKDNVITLETNTPQVLPPMRKSSSTPRRTSHVRVLDFATPRRILHETINEQVPSQSSDPPVEIVLSGSPNVVSSQATASEIVVTKSNTAVVNEGGSDESELAKEHDGANTVKQVRKYDWDADLRALVANEKDTSTKRKPKTKASLKKKKSSDKTDDTDKTEKKRSQKQEEQKKSRSKKSPRVRKPKVRRKIEEDDEPPTDLDKKSDVLIKPTINVIPSNYHEKVEVQERRNDTEITKNKSHENDDQYIDTPETERLSLQNVMGAKLNISDLLETPYKQALYDIQMETPRFLGPDLPGEPLSDVKIMNIPTPRFLNTPKPVQATPSSYSSRLTDYSSGGSYYKPDDQDYMPVPDLTICPATSSKEDLCVVKPTENDSEEKKSRPVRQCTKNVSYYKNSSVVNKTKDVEDNLDAASSCSEIISINSSFEIKNNKEPILKTPRASQSLSRTETKKRTSICKKRKSPKDKTKSFMKIKPRYTPKKETPGRYRKILTQSPHSKGSPSFQQRKRTTSKENLANAIESVVPVQTKSRRKSSTPRKLHCTKSFNSESSGHDSPETVTNIQPNVSREKSVKQQPTTTQDSDTEQIALRWSDDGSQDAKLRDIPINRRSREIEDITKIQEFLDSSEAKKHVLSKDGPMQENLNKQVRIESNTNNTLQRDLMSRGFDLETAKIIERDLLDDTPVRVESTNSRNISVEIVKTKKNDPLLDKTVETDSSITNELQIVQEEADDEEIELSVHECNEESNNYFVFEHDDTKETAQGPPIKLKENFTMEICIDEGVTMRLRATPFSLVLDQDPLTVDEIDYSYKETELAVNSISNINRLYTPLKNAIKAQCFEIFDSTLTSIDTPIKEMSPRIEVETTVTELVLEEEIEVKGKMGAKKRKRLTSPEEPASSKRTKPDADLLLKTANIQNIDIETVLTKLHGH